MSNETVVEQPKEEPQTNIPLSQFIIIGYREDGAPDIISENREVTVKDLLVYSHTLSQRINELTNFNDQKILSGMGELYKSMDHITAQLSKLLASVDKTTDEGSE